VIWLIYMCVMQSRLRHATEPVTCRSLLRSRFVCHDCSRAHTCDMTHSHVWHDMFKSVICDSDCVMPPRLWHMNAFTWLFICVTWLIYICDMQKLWHASFNRLYVWHDSFVCVTYKGDYDMPKSLWQRLGNNSKKGKNWNQSEFCRANIHTAHWWCYFRRRLF